MTQSFRSWRVVLCAFTLMFVGFGAAYSFAAFFRAFQSEFGASRAHISLVFSLCAFLYFLLGAPGGMLADRYGVRRVALAGVAFLVAGLAAASFATSVAVLYATYSIGLGIGIWLTYVPSVAAVQHWFTQKRAFASGIAVAGIGAGNLVVPPLAGWWIEALGWRGAYLALAGFTLLLGSAAAAAIRDRPAPRGEVHEGATLGAALASGKFRVLFVTLLCAGFGCFVPLVHLGPYAVDQGHPESFGVLLVSLIGLGGLGGRFVIGGLADRIGRMRTLALMYAGMALALAGWWASTGSVALATVAVAFGAAYGGFVATLPSVMMDLFGPRALSGIIGWMYIAPGIGTLAGPPLAGAAFDAYGSYDLPILGAAALSLIAAAGVLALMRGEPRRAASR